MKLTFLQKGSRVLITLFLQNIENVIMYSIPNYAQLNLAEKQK